jgi:hypothetical protein
MDNASLMCLAAMDNLEARAEVLRRHVMDIDNVSYAEACKTYKKIRDFNRSVLGVAHTIPYRIGIATATAAAFASIPLCFHLPRYEFALLVLYMYNVDCSLHVSSNSYPVSAFVTVLPCIL